MNTYTITIRTPAGNIDIRLKAQSEEHARILASACMNERESIEAIIPDKVNFTQQAATAGEIA